MDIKLSPTHKKLIILIMLYPVVIKYSIFAVSKESSPMMYIPPLIMAATYGLYMTFLCHRIHSSGINYFHKWQQKNTVFSWLLRGMMILYLIVSIFLISITLRQVLTLTIYRYANTNFIPLVFLIVAIFLVSKGLYVLGRISYIISLTVIVQIIIAIVFLIPQSEIQSTLPFVMDFSTITDAIYFFSIFPLTIMVLSAEVERPIDTKQFTSIRNTGILYYILLSVLIFIMVASLTAPVIRHLSWPMLTSIRQAFHGLNFSGTEPFFLITTTLADIFTISVAFGLISLLAFDHTKYQNNKDFKTTALLFIGFVIFIATYYIRLNLDQMEWVQWHIILPIGIMITLLFTLYICQKNRDNL